MARNAIYSLVTLFLLLSIFIYFGSQDDETIDDQGLSALVERVPESENGFMHIAFTQDEGYETFSSSCEKKKLQRHLDQEHWPVKWDDDLLLKSKVQPSRQFIENLWDDQWVKKLLERQKTTIEATITASQAKRFDLNLNSKTFLDIDYIEIMDIGKLLVLKSMQHARDNELEEAIEASNAAINLSQRVKTEASHILISFMVGERIQQTALSWQAKLFQELEIPRHAYRSALNILDELSNNADLHYSQIAAGEYLYSENLILNVHKDTLMERWRIFFFPNEDEFYFNLAISNSFGREDLPLIENTINFLFATFPNFYYHKNTEISAYAEFLHSVKESALNGCQNISDTNTSPPSPEYTLADLITPNAIGLANRSRDTGAFNTYQLRHCLNRLQIEANKMILAANHARANHSGKAKSLEDVKKHLGEIEAIDPFSGEALKLSKDGSEIYSVGKTGHASEEDEGALFNADCHYEEACYNKPRFSLYHPPWFDNAD